MRELAWCLVFAVMICRCAVQCGEGIVVLRGMWVKGVKVNLVSDMRGSAQCTNAQSSKAQVLDGGHGI